MSELLVTEKNPQGIGFVVGGQGRAVDAAKIGPVGDIIDFTDELGNDGWLGEFAAVASFGANVVSAAFNPIATATGWVASWIIEHIYPLQDWLQEFTGDPEEIEAGASTWHNISLAAQKEAENLESLLGKIEGQVSSTLDAYRARVGQLKEVFEAQQAAAEQIAGVLQRQMGIVKFIYEMIRDMIAEALGMFAQSVAEEVFSLGLATPAVVAQISTWVGEKVAKITKWVNKAIDAFAKLSKITAKLVQALRKLGEWGSKLLKILGKPGEWKDRAIQGVGRRVGEKLADKLPESMVASRRAANIRATLKQMDKVKNKDALQGLEDQLPGRFAKTSRVPDAPEGKIRIPPEATQDILRAKGPKQLEEVFDKYGIDKDGPFDLAGWSRSLTYDQRVIFSRGLTGGEAGDFLLRRMSREDQVNFFSSLPEAQQRDRLMKHAGYVVDPESGRRAAGVPDWENYEQGRDFLEDTAGPRASSASKAAKGLDAYTRDETYRPPQE